ncbi:unnamed protein product, partial [Menidia menidia]
GLKSPDLAQLDDSYEHDNQLATFVIGLSDVTIINISMENSTEMKDVLQIAAHALLRMKKLGKKPVCHFVHLSLQNVGGGSAHSKCMVERKHLLEQLNEIMQIASEIEKLRSFSLYILVESQEINICVIINTANGLKPSQSPASWLRDPFDLDWDDEDNADTRINRLGLIVALFLCADSVLQQQITLKMSICQISVTLLHPHGRKSQSSLKT